MATAKKTENIVEIKPIVKKTVKVRIVGDSPLIMHAWDAKAKREILEKEIGAKKVKVREPKNPIADFVASMYWLTPCPEEMTADAVGEAIRNGARFGFPCTSFKQAGISAAYRLGWAKDKMSLRGVFNIVPDADGFYGGDLEIDWGKKAVKVVPNQFKPYSLVEIHSDPPSMREDAVKVGMGAADLRYRGEFENWWADLTVEYDENGPYSLDDIVNIINAGGFYCGVGDWRTERDGTNGAYHVEIK